MVKSINTKELLTKFPSVKTQLQKGVSFMLYYRSKPLAEITPAQEVVTGKKQKFTWDYFKKHVGHAKDRKPFSAVDLIRKDRGYSS